MSPIHEIEKIYSYMRNNILSQQKSIGLSAEIHNQAYANESEIDLDLIVLFTKSYEPR